MIEDLIEIGVDGASNSKSGGVFLFIIIMTIIGVGIAFYFSSSFATKCANTCPADFKIKKEMCFCEEGGKWNLKEFGK